MMRLLDRVAIVTGSSGGIGRATAVEFAREGADVVVQYRPSQTFTLNGCGDMSEPTTRGQELKDAYDSHLPNERGHGETPYHIALLQVQ